MVPTRTSTRASVPLEGASLSQVAEGYFAQSEQTPTRLRIAIGESWEGGRGPRLAWAAGPCCSRSPATETRGSARDDWDHVRALYETVEDAELLDPDLSAGNLLYRLFNEDGVRLFEPAQIARRCSCERERLLGIVASFPPEDRAEMETDGTIVMTCEYCNKDWGFGLEEVAAAATR